MEIGNSFLIQHFMNSVWLIHPEKLKTMSEVIVKKVSEDFDGSLNLLQIEPKERRPSNVQRFGQTAVLNIEGTLVPKCSWLDSMCGFVSTLSLHTQFNELVEDRTVERIVLYFDSPGGVGIGIPEFAQSIYDARGVKEVVSFTDVYMCSAAYWLGSAAENLIATPSAIIGSIGTYISLIKERADKQSYDVHIVQAGDNKLFGNPQTPLTEEEINYFQEKVNQNYETFTDSVAQFRNTTQEAVKDTKAGYYASADAPEWMYTELGDVNLVLS